jgi:hypothetical protein
MFEEIVGTSPALQTVLSDLSILSIKAPLFEPCLVMLGDSLPRLVLATPVPFRYSSRYR